MAATTIPTRTYPKRKRTEISYHESSSDEGEGGDEYGTSDEALMTKTRKKFKSGHTSMSTKSLPKRKIFPFTSLPAELKNQIYDIALNDRRVINLSSKTKRYRRTVQRWPPDDRSPLNPNILLLNRAIYAETQPILYADNVFSFDDTAALHAFLAIIGPKNRATLTELIIRRWGHGRTLKVFNHAAFTILGDAVSLTRLYLDCDIAWRGPETIAQQLYRDGFHWFEAVGAAKGKFDAALDVIEISKRQLSNCYGGMQGNDSPEQKMEIVRAELRRMLR